MKAESTTPTRIVKGMVFFRFFFLALILWQPIRTHADILDDAMLDALNDFDIRGASIAYFDRNTLSEPILRSYGKVSTSESSQNITPETVFMIASVSKIFAGVAVSKLVSQGIIDLDDDICDVLPDVYADSSCRNPAFPDTPVTWRMLVTHRSSLMEGIPTVNGKEAGYGPSGGYVDGAAAGNPTCPLTDVKGFYRDILIDKATETSVGAGLNVDWYQVAQASGGSWEDFEPGSESLYSNFAIGYIAALVEFATNQSFPDYCQEHIFAPLGMQNTAWFREDLPEDVLETLPIQYVGGSGGSADSFQSIDHYCFIDYASGSLRTTAKDMTLFLDSMLDYGTPKLWSSEGVGQTSLRCAEEGLTVATDECEFGVTWILMQKDTAEDWLEPAMDLDWSDAAMHDGAEVGSQTQVVLFPNAGIYAVVFTNTDSNDDYAAQEVMKEVLSKAPSVLNEPDDDGDTSASPTFMNLTFLIFQTLLLASALLRQ